MPQYVVAIDLGPNSARAVVIEASLRRAEVVATHAVIAEPDEEPAVRLQRLRSLLPAQLDSVIINADAAAASVRTLVFPFEDMRKVEAALGFELENQVPFAVEEIATSWLVSQRGNGRTELLTAITPRDALLQQVEQLREAGMEPRAMMLPAAGLAELVPEPGEAPVAVVSLGDTQSHLAVLQHGLHFARTLRAGGAGIDRILAAQYKVSPAEARQAKESDARLLAPGEEASEEVRAVSEALAAGLDPLVRELALTLKALPPEQTPAKLVLTGGLSRLPGLEQHLAARLGLPVELLDLRASLGTTGCALEALGPEWAVATGMALSVLRRGRAVPLNFRRGDLAYHGDIQVYRGGIVRLAVGLAVIFLLAIFGSVLRYSMVAREEKDIHDSFAELTRRVVGRPIRDPTVALSVLRSDGGGGEGITIPTYSATALFELMSRAIDKNVDVSFEDLEFRVNGRADDPDRISGKGETASFETTEEIVAALKRHPCFQAEDAVEISNQKKNRANRVEFHFAAKASCPPGIDPTAAMDELARGDGGEEVAKP